MIQLIQIPLNEGIIRFKFFIPLVFGKKMPSDSEDKVLLRIAVRKKENYNLITSISLTRENFAAQPMRENLSNTDATDGCVALLNNASPLGFASVWQGFNAGFTPRE